MCLTFKTFFSSDIHVHAGEAEAIRPLKPRSGVRMSIVFVSSDLANPYIIIFRSYMGEMLQIHVFSSIHK